MVTANLSCEKNCTQLIHRITPLQISSLHLQPDEKSSEEDEDDYDLYSFLNSLNISLNLNQTDEATQGLPVAKQVACFIATVAILANMCSLLAIWHIKKKLNVNLRLIISLCLSDTLVALSLLILSSNSILIPMGAGGGSSMVCIVPILRAIRMGAHIVTLFNLLGLALDHYYAIVRTLYYRFVMDTRKVTWGIVTMWLVSMVLGFSDFYMPSALYDYCNNPAELSNLCSRTSCSKYDNEQLVFVLTLVTLVCLISIYLSIFLTLRQNNSMLSRHRSIMRKKKQGMFTTILILGTFMVCWLPYCLFETCVLILLASELDQGQFMRVGRINIMGSYYLYNVLLINSLCDPIIYALRMREVQRGYQNTIARVSCQRYAPSHQQMWSKRRQSSESLMTMRIHSSTQRAGSNINAGSNRMSQQKSEQEGKPVANSVSKVREGSVKTRVSNTGESGKLPASECYISNGHLDVMHVTPPCFSSHSRGKDDGVYVDINRDTITCDENVISVSKPEYDVGLCGKSNLYPYPSVQTESTEIGAHAENECRLPSNSTIQNEHSDSSASQEVVIPLNGVTLRLSNSSCCDPENGDNIRENQDYIVDRNKVTPLPKISIDNDKDSVTSDDPIQTVEYHSKNRIEKSNDSGFHETYSINNIDINAHITAIEKSSSLHNRMSPQNVDDNIHYSSAIVDHKYPQANDKIQKEMRQYLLSSNDINKKSLYNEAKAVMPSNMTEPYHTLPSGSQNNISISNSGSPITGMDSSQESTISRNHRTKQILVKTPSASCSAYKNNNNSKIKMGDITRQKKSLRFSNFSSEESLSELQGVDLICSSSLTNTPLSAMEGHRLITNDQKTDIKTLFRNNRILSRFFVRYIKGEKHRSVIGTEGITD